MARQTRSTVRSPCIGTCLYDPAESACLGCKRTPSEIYDWLIMTDEQRLAVLKRIEDDTMARPKVSSDKPMERSKTGDRNDG